MELPTVDRPESLARRAHVALREAIRDRRLVPGDIHSEQEVGTAMGISRTPVREAVLQLSREGLVEILPQRGFRVRSPSAGEVAEVFGMRRALEGYVVGELARRATDEHVRRLRAVLDRQEQLLGDPGRFLAVDEELHLLMPELLSLERTREALVGLRGVMWLTGALAMTVRDRGRAVLDEHVAIVDAVERRDEGAAVAAMQRHIDNTLGSADLDVHAG